MAETGRQRWTERVEQWKQSGLTAREFAEQAGLNAGTLSYWKWRLSRSPVEASSPRTGRKRHVRKPKLVELTPVALSDDRVELELSNGHRLRVPSRFDARALARLISIVAGAS
jgi:transposase